MKDRKTLRFGSMGEMGKSGLALVANEGEIEGLFSQHDELLKRHILALDDEFAEADKTKPIDLGPGICILPPNIAFRSKTADTWRIVVSGQEQDEVFYLVFSANEAIPVDGGFVPEGLTMEVFFRDGCGRPGLEATLYKLVTERFRNLIGMISVS